MRKYEYLAPTLILSAARLGLPGAAPYELESSWIFELALIDVSEPSPLVAIIATSDAIGEIEEYYNLAKDEITETNPLYLDDIFNNQYEIKDCKMIRLEDATDEDMIDVTLFF